jgi:hypothetical protein
MAASASGLSARLYNYRDARRAGCDADVALQQTVRTRGLGTQIQLSTEDESGMVYYCRSAWNLLSNHSVSTRGNVLLF